LSARRYALSAFGGTRAYFHSWESLQQLSELSVILTEVRSETLLSRQSKELTWRASPPSSECSRIPIARLSRMAVDLSGVFDLEYAALRMQFEAKERARERGGLRWLVGSARKFSRRPDADAAPKILIRYVIKNSLL